MYTISEPSGILRKNGVVVEQDDRVAEYRSYVVWLSAGNGPAVVADTDLIRTRIDVSAWQIRKALNRKGWRQQVEDAVAASTDLEVKDGWMHSARFYSDNRQALQMGAILNKTPDEIYELYRLAETL